MTKFDLRSPEFTADPFPVYRQMREQDPVYWSGQMRGWILTRYHDVKAVLKDADHFRTAPATEFLPPQARRDLFVLSDRWASYMPQADHDAIRVALGPYFSAARIDARYGPFMQRRADELLERALASREMNFSEQFAHPLCFSVTAELLGFPSKNYEELAFLRSAKDDVSAAIARPASLDEYERGERACRVMADYLADVVAAHRKRPSDDLVTAWGKLFDDDSMVVQQTMMTFFAGYETPPSFLENGLLALLLHPEQREHLQRDRSLLDSAVEEIMRYWGPLQLVMRRATKDVEIGGKMLKKGDAVVLMLGAANRDPEAFDHPDQFDITAKRSHRHLALGMGPHVCIGSTIARLEGRIAFETLLRRLPNLRLRDGAVPAWQTKNIRFRRLETLAIEFS